MTFDAQAFLDASTTETSATFLEPIPENEYPAVISDVSIRSGASDKGPWAMLDIKFETQDPALEEKLGRKPVSKMSVFLDQDDPSQKKNVNLGRIREALNLNQEGRPFSPRMMIGMPCKVAIKHREYNGAIYDEVRAVLKAA